MTTRDLRAAESLPLINDTYDEHRDARWHCPRCALLLTYTAITKQLQTYEPCTCERVGYRHLYEQSWHQTCFVAGKAT